DHALRVGEPGGIELVRAPLRVAPVAPVLDDHVEREPAPPELAHRVEKLGRAVVALAALPIAVSPLREERRAAGHAAIACDHVVQARSADEGVVDSFRGGRPDARGTTGGPRRQPAQVERTVGVAPPPLDLQAVTTARLER